MATKREENRTAEINSFWTKHGRDVKSVSPTGWTVLHKAVKLGKYVEIVQFLVSHGANVNARNKTNCVPLHYARNIDVAKYLVHNGAEVNIKNIDGSTPLDLAERRKKTTVVEFLLSVGAKNGYELP